MKNIFKPMLFSTPMVQAIVEGRKTQTRRIIKDNMLQNSTENDDIEFLLLTVSHKYNLGDILWVRETFFPKEIHEEPPGDLAHYKALDPFASSKWKPSIFMPKEACRIFLKVISVKIERLQDISEEDSILEGCSVYGPFGEYKGSLHPSGGSMRYRAYSKASRAFQCIWETINGSESWNKNPWVWVIEFEKIDKPLNFIV